MERRRYLPVLSAANREDHFEWGALQRKGLGRALEDGERLEGRRLLNSMTGGDSGILDGCWQLVNKTWPAQPVKGVICFGRSRSIMDTSAARVFFKNWLYLKITISIAKTRLLYNSISIISIIFRLSHVVETHQQAAATAVKWSPRTLWQERVFLKRTLRSWDRAWEQVKGCHASRGWSPQIISYSPALETGRW